jgi:hypothetical protein
MPADGTSAAHSPQQRLRHVPFQGQLSDKLLDLLVHEKGREASGAPTFMIHFKCPKKSPKRESAGL